MEVFMKLTADEIRLLRDLESRGGETTMSGNRRHADLDRIVEAGLMSRQVARGTTDTVIYTMTDDGRDWLEKHKEE
jgi:hypothetical protein